MEAEAGPFLHELLRVYSPRGFTGHWAVYNDGTGQIIDHRLRGVDLSLRDLGKVVAGTGAVGGIAELASA